MSIEYIAIGFLVIVIGFGTYVLRCIGRVSISEKKRQAVLSDWEKVLNIDHAAQQVLQGDNVLQAAFLARGWYGSVGDVLRKHGHTLPNKEAVWVAHKLRNRIAHEAHIHVSKTEAQKAIQAFGKAISVVLSGKV